jgi:hypothetical protein
MKPIQLDMKSIVRTASLDPTLMEHRGGCTYSTPCIIGLALTEEQRLYIKSAGLRLIKEQVVSFPSLDELKDACDLQYLMVLLF